VTNFNNWVKITEEAILGKKVQEAQIIIRGIDNDEVKLDLTVRRFEQEQIKNTICLNSQPILYLTRNILDGRLSLIWLKGGERCLLDNGLDLDTYQDY
jgi:hypothetical protein